MNIYQPEKQDTLTGLMMCLIARTGELMGILSKWISGRYLPDLETLEIAVERMIVAAGEVVRKTHETIPQQTMFNKQIAV